MTEPKRSVYNPGSPSNRIEGKHRIALISHRQGRPSSEAPVVCDCGWQGIALDWQQHKKEAPEGD